MRPDRVNRCHPRGVTTAQYALVLAAIAFTVYGGYVALSANLRSLVSGTDSTLTTVHSRAVEGTPVPSSLGGQQTTP
jgi:hypothetical protein